MDEEMDALIKNEAFELTELQWRMVSTKENSNGKIYLQIPNSDYHETFSPTAKLTSIRRLMQLAAMFTKALSGPRVNMLNQNIFGS